MEHYLRVTDEVREELRNSVVRYVQDVRSLDQKKDSGELQSLSEAYESTWRSLLETVENTTPPGKAELYHRTLKRSLQLQLEIPKLFADIIGAQESRKDLRRSVQVVRTEIVELNKLLDQERKRLLQLVTDETSSSETHRR